MSGKEGASRLTPEDIFIWNQSGKYATEIHQAISEQSDAASPTVRVIGLLNHRIAGAMNSLWVLKRNAPHDFGLDGMMVLRGLYDVHLQALYILVDPNQCDARSTQFIDFQWIEHRVMKLSIDSNKSRMAQKIRTSTRRAKAEAVQDAEYERVSGAYRTRKGKTHNNWYCGNLRDLVRRLGDDLESEYLMMQPLLSSAVHSSPHRLLVGSVLPDDAILIMGWHFTFRVLGKFAECLGVRLRREHEDLTLRSCENVFNEPTWG